MYIVVSLCRRIPCSFLDETDAEDVCGNHLLKVGSLSILQYSHLDQLSVSAVRYAKEDEKLLPLIICKEHYRQGSGNHTEETYEIDAQTESGDLRSTRSVLKSVLMLDHRIAILLTFNVLRLSLP